MHASPAGTAVSTVRRILAARVRPSLRELNKPLESRLLRTRAHGQGMNWRCGCVLERIERLWKSQ